jgi:hypothetical protein
VFTEVIPIPPRTFPIGFKWVFVQNRNENNEVVRYKVRLVAQDFMQRPDVDFNRIYSPIMNEITIRYLISLTIYIKVSDGISVSNTNRNIYCVKLVKSLYGLEQSGRMWYNQLNEFLLNKGYLNSDDCPYMFIRKSSTGFCIISVYIDDLNIIGHAKDIDEARNHLKKEFKMKDLDKTKFCLGLQIEYLHTGILIHQSIYVKKVLEQFNMDKA